MDLRTRVDLTVFLRLRQRTKLHALPLPDLHAPANYHLWFEAEHNSGEGWVLDASVPLVITVVASDSDLGPGQQAAIGVIRGQNPSAVQ